MKVKVPKLKAPFPYAGGKSRVAHVVWERFGDVPNYCEPFYGSGAVLLGRPHEPGIETVNDIDCHLANFWRCFSHCHAQPETWREVAKWADWPVNEADLHARHLWLVQRDEFRERMKTDPDYFDAKVAGWWVWGISQWIGGGWCKQPTWRGRVAHGAARGIHANVNGDGMGNPWRKRPLMRRSGSGVHRQLVERRRPGMVPNGVHRQLPDISGNDGAAGKGVHAGKLANIEAYFEKLSVRLRKVRVACGDFKRILGPSPTIHIGLTAVFLDPPYSAAAGRDNDIYACEDPDVAHKAREWAIENGNNRLLRICLAGYEGEHVMPDDWECFAWRSPGGYAVRADGRGKKNRDRERLWFSPHCLKPENNHPELGL